MAEENDCPRCDFDNYELGEYRVCTAEFEQGWSGGWPRRVGVDWRRKGVEKEGLKSEGEVGGEKGKDGKGEKEWELLCCVVM